MPLAEIETLFGNYDKQSYDIFSQQGAEPEAADVALFESTIGFSLPAEFVEFAVHPLGGLYIAVKKEIWPRPRKHEVGEFWSFLYGLYVYSFSHQAPDWLQIGNAWRQMSDDGFPQLVPFLKIVGDPDPYCFTPEQQIVIWRHETPSQVEKVNRSFYEVLLFEIRELQERKERKTAT